MCRPIGRLSAFPPTVLSMVLVLGPDVTAQKIIYGDAVSPFCVSGPPVPGADLQNFWELSPAPPAAQHQHPDEFCDGIDNPQELGAGAATL